LIALFLKQDLLPKLRQLLIEECVSETKRFKIVKNIPCRLEINIYLEMLKIWCVFGTNNLIVFKDNFLKVRNCL